MPVIETMKPLFRGGQHQCLLLALTGRHVCFQFRHAWANHTCGFLWALDIFLRAFSISRNAQINRVINQIPRLPCYILWIDWPRHANRLRAVASCEPKLSTWQHNCMSFGSVVTRRTRVISQHITSSISLSPANISLPLIFLSQSN